MSEQCAVLEHGPDGSLNYQEYMTAVAEHPILVAYLKNTLSDEDEAKED